MPEGLSERSQALWLSEIRDRSRSLGRLAMLEECLRALDQADHFRGLLATQELVQTTKTTGATHINPLVKAEKEARIAFLQMAKALGLDWKAGTDRKDTEYVKRFSWMPDPAMS